MAAINVTQLEAAHRQLRTAIELWANDGDPVSIHTLAAAAHQVVHDINRSRKGPPMLLDSPFVRPEMKQQFYNAVKADSNYFKHADARKKYKPPPSIDFETELNELFFMVTISGLDGMGEKLTQHEIAFKTWTAIQRPDLLNDAFLEALSHAIEPENLKAWRSTGKKEFLKTALRMQGFV